MRAGVLKLLHGISPIDVGSCFGEFNIWQGRKDILAATPAKLSALTLACGVFRSMYFVLVVQIEPLFSALAVFGVEHGVEIQTKYTPPPDKRLEPPLAE